MPETPNQTAPSQPSPRPRLRAPYLDKRRLAELDAAGLSTAQIARLLDRSPASIRQARYRLNGGRG